MEILGWLGAACLAVCALPQALNSMKHKNSFGISWMFLTLWMLGEVFTLIYIIPKKQWPILFNLLSNIFLISIIIYYKIWPQNKPK